MKPVTRLYLITTLFSIMGQFAQAQCTSAHINEAIINLDNQKELQPGSKLQSLLAYRQQFNKCRIMHDSVYAKILQKIGYLEYVINNGFPTSNSIQYTLESIRINTSGAKNCDPATATKSFNNISLYYKLFGLNHEALNYYDSTIVYVYRYPQYNQFLFPARYEKGNIYFKRGDYQRCIEEATIGISESSRFKKVFPVLVFMNQRAQAYLFEGKKAEALREADVSVTMGKQLLQQNNTGDLVALNESIFFELANAYKIKALASVSKSTPDELNAMIGKAVGFRERSYDFNALADDYIDYGSFYFTDLKDFSRAGFHFNKSMKYASGSNVRLAYAYLNLGALAFRKGNYKEAELYYLKSLRSIGLLAASIHQNPSLQQIIEIEHKEFVHVLLNNKTEILLYLYQQTGNRSYLESCLKTALLTDSLVTFMRHDHSAEQSKIFWRKRTREFYTNALEASFLSGNAAMAYQFMESSRAVILSDKLDELGAFAYLPQEEAVKEQHLRENIRSAERELAVTVSGSDSYQIKNVELIRSRHQLEEFIQALEYKYPAYYQYKYAGNRFTINDLQQFLKKYKQSFVHYFLGDTVTYVLAITPSHTKMIRVPATRFTSETISTLLEYISDKHRLNTNFRNYCGLSYSLYKELFEPLHLPGGRVIISPDQFLFPFESLYKDGSGKELLLQDHAFSYVYSARYLLKKSPDRLPSGNFMGFAPVSFSSSLGVTPLQNSGSFLSASASYYKEAELFTKNRASRNNFLNQIGKFRVVNVFSHAKAGLDPEEPVLYMQDSIIRLTELQYLQNHGTQLIVLSACQTNVGKHAMGEGIYSLARGFSAAGIPSVAATLWKADEKAIYFITGRFHKYLATGERKDDALQKAKMDFLNSANHEEMLPYFWANMVLIGDSVPISLLQSNSGFWEPVFISISAIIFISAFGILKKNVNAGSDII